VVVPHCRTVDDLLALLDVICREDEDVRGDFWREQSHVQLPKPQDIRPASMFSLADPNSLKGKRLAVPKMYINKDPDADIEVRSSIMKLWEKAAADLKALGAELVETDFPVVTQYEKGTKTTNTAFAGLSADWDILEIERFIGMGWHRFLQLNGQPGLDRLKDVDPKKIFPPPPGALPDKAGGTSWNYAGMLPTSDQPFESIEGFADGLKRLETFRQKHFEEWLDENGFDGCVFPANADIGRADSDVNPESAAHAWKNGVYFSNVGLLSYTERFADLAAGQSCLQASRDANHECANGHYGRHRHAR
jgi:amidase